LRTHHLDVVLVQTVRFTIVAAVVVLFAAAVVPAGAQASPATPDPGPVPVETPEAHPPEANDDAFVADPGTGLRLDLLANDTDPDGDPLTIIALDNPTSLGGLVFNNGDGTVDYNAPEDIGVDTFTYTVSDGALIDTAMVSITISAPTPTPTLPPPTGPRAPSIIDGSLSYTTEQGQALVVPPPGLLSNIANPDDLPLELSAGILPRHGELNSFNADGSFTYVPAAGFEGADMFTYFMSANVPTSAGEVSSGVVEGRVEIFVQGEAPAVNSPVSTEIGDGVSETPVSTAVSGVVDQPPASTGVGGEIEFPVTGAAPGEIHNRTLMFAVILVSTIAGSAVVVRQVARRA
jgi:hypothetical protein